MIFNVNKKTEDGYFSCFKLLLEKSHIQRLVNSIQWIIPEDDYIYTKNDTLSKQEVNKIIKINPNLDFLKNYKIEVDEANIEGFILKDFIENKTILPQKGVGYELAQQLTPINNRPTFEYLGNKCIWIQELGLFQILEGNKGYYNPLNKCLCFKRYEDYNKYLNEINCLKNIEKKTKNMEDKSYVRIISVYDKKTKELKYRILNEEFNYNSFAFYNLKPFEGDEGIYFRSYKITKSLAKKYADWSYLLIDYDFEKNNYYFETLEASKFFYSQKELLKEIGNVPNVLVEK